MAIGLYILHGWWIVPFLCMVISAKWTRELGYAAIWQVLAALCGFVLGPIMPFLLYLRGFYGRAARAAHI